MSQCRIALQFYIVLIIIYFKFCFGCITHLPNNYGSDNNGITFFIIHFYFFTFNISCTQSDFIFCIKRVCPVKTIFFYGAHILSKKRNHFTVVWVNDEKSNHHKKGNNKQSSKCRIECEGGPNNGAQHNKEYNKHQVS